MTGLREFLGTVVLIKNNACIRPLDCRVSTGVHGKDFSLHRLALYLRLVYEGVPIYMVGSMIPIWVLDIIFLI
jgi:hypothetical protein